MAQLYQVLTTGTTTMTTADLDAGNSNQNQRIIDFNLSGGNITLNLPSLTSLFVQDAGATTFEIKGNILSGAFPNVLTLVASNTEGDVDTICGDATVTLNGVGTCFQLYIAGRNRWGINICTPNTQS